ncbi:MAG TPA: energy-coupling factor transporter ATPase [Ktedonobacteraceae bacterium]
MIELTNVTFNYSAQGEEGIPPALHDVNLRIREGELVAIIGHNGSGKSTLTRLVAAILHPQRGSILVDGLNAAAGEENLWAVRQRVGVVFQNPDDQLIASTVIDEIAFGPENLTLPRQEIEERVREALALLELEPYAQMALSELSISLKQRVAIAGVLAMRPRYLLLDEPTAMVSGHTARQLLRTLSRLARSQGIAVIHITHFMHEITSFERVIVMDAGRVLMDGAPAEIFARVAELQAVGLDVPMVTHLGRRLFAQGWTRAPEVVLAPSQLLGQAFDPAAETAELAPPDFSRGQREFAEAPANQGIETQTTSDERALFVLKDLVYTHQRDTPFAQPALQGLTLALPARRFIALVGPGGSGKSTLVDLLAGLLRPHGGTLLFDGADTGVASFKLERLRARVGVVFQSPELQIFEETVGKDVSFGPRQKKVPLAESRRLVQESLEAVGLSYEDYRTRYTYALSGGQKRRVAIAGVLALQPEVIIFDEPMAGLDPRGRAELFKLLQTLKQRDNLTIIYATGSLKDVIELADSIHVLERGRLAFSGAPRDMLRRAEALHSLDIALPEAAQIALSLRASLPALRTDVVDLEELVSAFHQAQNAEASSGEMLDSPLSARVREEP